MQARGRPARDAFTLLELLVWIVVASLAAATGTVLLGPWAQERKLRDGACRLAAALEYGRDVARHEGRTVRVRVIPAGAGAGASSVHLTYAADGADVVHPLTKASFRVDFAGDPALLGIRVLASDADGDDTVEFDARGQPVDASSQFTLQVGDRRSVVRVEPCSGRVTIDASAQAAVENSPLPPQPVEK